MSHITMIQSEIAQSLGVSKAKVNDLVKEYKLEGHTHGKTVAYPVSEVKRLYTALGKKINKKVIAVNNIKGGVGKTLFTRELGFSIAQQGAKTLMIDLDLQGTLSEICGVYNDELPTWKNIIKGELKIEELILPLKDNLSIVPCNIGMGGIDREIGNKNIALLVKQYIEQVMDDYDVVILDTRPEVSNINLAAIIASDIVLVPAKADTGSHKGIRDTFREIELAEKEYDLYVPERGIDKKIIINLFKSTRNTELLKFSEINQEFGEFLHKDVLNDNNDMAKAYNEKEFLYSLKRTSPINKFMRDLAVDVLDLNKQSGAVESEEDEIHFEATDKAQGVTNVD